MTTTALTSADVIGAIIDGVTDDRLDALFDAIKNRRKAIATKTLLTTQVGARVRITDIRPAYLVGAEGEVVGRKNSRLSVKLDNPAIAMRFTRDGVLQVPAGCVQVI
jgi:hypothetical protein